MKMVFRFWLIGTPGGSAGELAKGIKKPRSMARSRAFGRQPSVIAGAPERPDAGDVG
jgi:hypothetical protein